MLKSSFRAVLFLAQCESLLYQILTSQIIIDILFKCDKSTYTSLFACLYGNACGQHLCYTF